MRKDDEILLEDSQRACRFLKILLPLWKKYSLVIKPSFVIGFMNMTCICMLYMKTLHQKVVSNKESVASQNFLC